MCLAAAFYASANCAYGRDAESQREVEALRKSNAALEELVRQQQSVIEGLNSRVTALEQTGSKRSDADETMPPASSEKSGGFTFGKVSISGEGGVALFHSGSEGMFPNTEFRVDEAKLFVEAPVWGRVYFFTELNLAQREEQDLNLRVGELYLDVENLFGFENNPRLLNLRVGRIDIPFGEEYLSRDAIDNPLIAHSLTDFWGVDEGIEIYGSAGKFGYVLAVQNGGVPVTQDFTKDKAIVGRISYDPTKWLHFSVSAMRTGDLDATDDFLSEIWYGGGWFRSIGGPGTTRFHANLVQGDVAMRWRTGDLKVFGGAVGYDDNDPVNSNSRTMFYYTVEAQQQVVSKFYVAARFSQILADEGYPINGLASMGNYFFNFSPNALTTDLWRLTLGVGYRFSDRFVIKTDYSLERGKTIGGDNRSHEDLFAAEAAFKF